MSRYRGSGGQDVYNASSDLAFCLLVIMIIVFVVVAKDRNTIRSGVEAREKEAAASVESAQRQARQAEAALEQARAEAAQRQSQLLSALEQAQLETREAKIALEKSLKETDQRDAAIRQELLGLPGSLDRVVFLIDRSGSMNDDQRWERTRGIVSTWLRYLPVKQAVVITFGDQLTTYPEAVGNNPTWVTMDAITRDSIIKFLASQAPSGGTPTLAALKKAADLDGVQTIVLFTDGKPSDLNLKDKTTAEEDILAFSSSVLRKRGITVNTIGLGMYFESAGSVMLLKQLADETKGSFRGF